MKREIHKLTNQELANEIKAVYDTLSGMDKQDPNYKTLFMTLAYLKVEQHERSYDLWIQQYNDIIDQLNKKHNEKIKKII